MKGLNYLDVIGEDMEKITKGAFLTVKAGEALNTMTIGWATFGFIWRKPIMMVAVRTSRHTFGIIEKSQDFTVTIPSGDLKKEIAFCGSKSGRDLDKFKMCNLETAASRKVVSPIIKTPGHHYECVIVYKTIMDPMCLDKNIEATLYSDKDYHTLYFGEILACYEIS